jgi:hypothetical protein
MFRPWDLNFDGGADEGHFYQVPYSGTGSAEEKFTYFLCIFVSAADLFTQSVLCATVQVSRILVSFGLFFIYLL